MEGDYKNTELFVSFFRGTESNITARHSVYVCLLDQPSINRNCHLNYFT